MNTVAIVGVGLIGGSFGLALKSAGFAGEVIGVSSERAVEAALSRGAINCGASLADAVGAADLIYLAQPVSGIITTLRCLDSWVRPDALVTDAGSTKQLIQATARAHLKRCAFLGGHPLAGKESRGVENADAALFRERPYVLTPGDPQDLEREVTPHFREWLARIGAREVVMGAEEHDRAVAFTSHLPQLASTALASMMADVDAEVDGKLPAGPALAGVTRLALSPYEMWRDIFVTNTDPIEEALTAYIQRLEYLKDNLRRREMRDEFARGAAWVQRLR